MGTRASEQVVVAGAALGLVAVAWALVAGATALGRTGTTGAGDALWVLALVLVGWAVIGCLGTLVLLARRWTAARSWPAVGLAALGVAALAVLLVVHPLVGTGSAAG